MASDPKKRARFIIHICVHDEFMFDVGALWPDGDAPENPTVGDVVKLINDSGGSKRFVDEWDLPLDYRAFVREESEESPAAAPNHSDSRDALGGER